MRDGRTRLRHACLTLALLAAAWSAILILTDGVVLSLGPLHVSSRNARNPAFAALLLLVAATLAAPPGSRRLTLADDVRRFVRTVASRFAGNAWLSRVRQAAARPAVASAFVLLLMAWLLGASWTRGAYIAGGSDSFGYVSEAHLFATGRMRVALPLAHAFPHVPPQAMTPLGYRPAEDSDELVPTYAPGLPLTMAVVERIAGMQAVYAVMPALAVIAVWFTYRLGVQLSGLGTGLGAALLLATSPAFVFQLLGAPMSDVPAMGWWTMSLSLLLREGRWTAAAAGMAAGVAILTRPNLLLVVVVLGLYLLWRVVPQSPADGRVTGTGRSQALGRLVWFSLPVIGCCLVVAGFNAAWYGSPFRSGYSADLFNVSFWRDNVRNYPRWLAESQTPLLFLGFLAPFVVHWIRPDGDRRRPATLVLAGVAVTVFVSYLFYMPFDAWWYLRFLLPGYPPLAVLTAVALTAIAARMGSGARIAAVALVIAVAAFAYARTKDDVGLGEYRYRLIAEWMRDHAQGRPILIAMQHSGSLMHYAELPIVRYDLVARGDYESALDEMIRGGYHPYLVIDEWEVETLRKMHGGGERGALDWPPIAVLPLANVSVWDLAEDRSAARASGRTPQRIAVPEFILRHLP